MTMEAINRLRGEPDALARTPCATYRVQLGAGFGFEEAAAIVDYLDALGITDLYVSPILETASRDSHGYDVSDHGRLREELGGEPAFRRLAETLAARGLGLLVDLVPNHMGIARARNPWWRDVLENGPSSTYAATFDIDWHPVKVELHDKVLLPILGDQYGAVLDRGELRLELVEGRFELVYGDTRLPIAMRSYGRVLGHRLEDLQARVGPDDPGVAALKDVIAWVATIPPRTERDPARVAAREGEQDKGRRRLVALLADFPAVRAFVEDSVTRFNGTPGEPTSFDLLDALVSDQAYRLAYWRVAGEEINYRRFFDINDLAAIRMEDRQVFDRAHRLVARLVRDGVITGLRIDHPDGLYAPAEYFRRLQDVCVAATGRPVYILAEKILSPGERLPDTWAVAGTTGYEFLNLLNGIFVDRTAAGALERLHTRLSGRRVPFTEVVHESKRLVMETSMASELNMLGHRLNGMSEKHRSSRDFTLGSLTTALREVIAGFPVYRTYFGESADPAVDREHLERAIEGARRRGPALDASIYQWLLDLLSLRFPPWGDAADRQERTDFVMRFQQITGPVTAKGYEDTALYRYARLVSLNEVGGDPSRFGTPLAEFHAVNAERAAREPAALSATSTHDTKRSEDVRARINVLSEVPDEWRRRVARWHRLNRRLGTVVDGDPVPGPTDEYLLYQTLVGAWPIGPDRLCAYVLKAAREAKLRTSWIHRNERYEGALTRFTGGIVHPHGGGEFLRDFTDFQARVAHFGRLNSLAQTLVKITAPGVPDFYQGTELWDFSLVDPDNRRPVDFALRRRLLDALPAVATGEGAAASARALAEGADEGLAKLWVVHRALHFRRRHPELFLRGAYRALGTSGPWSENLCAFARQRGDAVAVAVVPRLLARRQFGSAAVGGTGPAAGERRTARHRRAEAPAAVARIPLPLGLAFWEGTRVEVPVAPGARLRDVFTGRVVTAEGAGAGAVGAAAGAVVRAADALAAFPLALLEAA